MAPLADENVCDEHLVKQVQQGDASAFEQLVTRYQDRVFNICFRLIGNHENARDLAQEAFIKAFEAIGGFEHRSRFYTWLFRLAVNVSISHRRRSKRIKLHSLNSGVDPDGDGSGVGSGPALRLCGEPADNRGSNPVKALRDKETRQLVAEALQELEEDFRTILVLRDVESLDYEAIANILDVPVGTVRSRLHRARLALRERLKPVLEKAG